MKTEVDLKRLQIGHRDAHIDDDLPSYFVATKAYDEALKRDRVLLLGERGSGKTAIRKQIQSEKGREKETIVVSISPSDEALSELIENIRTADLPTQTLMWEFIIYCEVFYHGRIGGQLKNTRRLKSVEAVLKEVYGHRAIPRKQPDDETSESMLNRLFEMASRLIGGVDYKYKAAGHELTVKFTDLFPKDDIRKPSDAVRKLRSAMRDYLKKGPEVFVLIDQLDDYWRTKTYEEEKEMITGLMQASYSIYGKFQRTNFNLTVFLRADIFEVLDFKDKDNLEALSHEIEWDRGELLGMLCTRFRHCLKTDSCDAEIWKDIFFVDGVRTPETHFGYFYNRTLCRPRDVIDFVREALSQAQREKDCSMIYARHVRAAERKYSDILLGFFTQDLSVPYPFLRSFISEFQGKSREFTRTTFARDRVASFKKKYGKDIREGVTWFLENMYKWGFVGVVPKKGATPVFYFDPSSSTEVAAAYRLVVHPGLRVALNLRRA